MQNLSLTIRGLAVAILGTVLRAAGHDMPDPELAAWVATATQIVGAVIVYAGRVRHGDITWYGKRK